MPRVKIPCSLMAVLFATSLCNYAQDSYGAIRQKLVSQYTLTQTTAAQDDIVTAGSVLVLKGGDIMMAPIGKDDVFQNSYKDGKIKQGLVGRFSKMRHVPGVSTPASPDQRTFVPGEKMWVTGITVNEREVAFSLFTDAYSDVRYHAVLKFPFPKGWTPTEDQVEKLVAQVFSIQPAEEAKGDAAQNSPAPAPQPASPQPAQPLPPVTAPPAPADQPLPAVVPPPAPTDEPAAPPQEINLTGKTPAQVVAAMGAPIRKVQGGNKEIYYYKDMKITFVKGIVSEVE